MEAKLVPWQLLAREDNASNTSRLKSYYQSCFFLLCLRTFIFHRVHLLRQTSYFLTHHNRDHKNGLSFSSSNNIDPLNTLQNFQKWNISLIFSSLGLSQKSIPILLFNQDKKKSTCFTLSETKKTSKIKSFSYKKKKKLD